VGGAVFHAVEKALGASFAPAVPVPAASPPESSPGPIVHRSSPDISASGSPVVSVRESGQAALSESSQVRIAFPGTQPEAATARSAGTPGSGPGQAESWDLITCFQIHGLFIVAPIAGGILLVDQHAAHERVLFEQALDDLDHGASASQQLLFPVVVELAPSEKALLDSRPEVFRKLGYEFGDFGGSAVSVSAIPAYIRPGHVEETIRDTIGFLLSDTEAKRFPDDRERFAAAFACGSAIKAGQELTREEMSALLNSLFAARSPYTCPHGRPTLTRLSLDELKRRFLR